MPLLQDCAWHYVPCCLSGVRIVGCCLEVRLLLHLRPLAGFLIVALSGLSSCGQPAPVAVNHPLTAPPLPSASAPRAPIALRPKAVPVAYPSIAGGIRLQWSPDGKLLAGQQYGQLWIWDYPTGVLRATLTEAKGIRSMLWSSTSDRVAFDTEDGVVLWSSKGQELRTTEAGVGSPFLLPTGGLAAQIDKQTVGVIDEATAKIKGRTGFGGPVLLWSDDKRVGLRVDKDAIEVWGADGKLLHRLPDSTPLGRPSVQAFRPKSHEFACGYQSGMMVIWDSDTGAEKARYRAHRWTVNVLAWKSDGTALASGSSDDVLSVWQAGQEKPAQISTKKSKPQALAWGPQSDRIAVCSSGGPAIVRWPSGDKMDVPKKLYGGDACAWSPQAEVFALVSSSALRFWSPWKDSFQNAPDRLPEIDALEWSPNSNAIALVVDRQLALLDTDSGALRGEYKPETGVLVARWSPDGANIAVTVGGQRAIQVLEGEKATVKAKLDLEKAPLPKDSPEEGWGALGLSWSPDGKILAGSVTARAVLFAWPQGTRLRELTAERKDFGSLSFSPDGSTLAIEMTSQQPHPGQWPFRDESIGLWSVQTGRKASTIPLGLVQGETVERWSPRGDLIAIVAGLGRKLQVFDPISRIQLFDSEGTETSDAAWSLDGSTIAVARGSVQLLEPRTGKVVREFKPGTLPSNNIAWHPSGRVLISIGNPVNMIRLADQSSLRLVLRAVEGKMRLGVITEEGLWDGDSEVLSNVPMLLGDDLFRGELTTVRNLGETCHQPGLLQAFLRGQSLDTSRCVVWK